MTRMTTGALRRGMKTTLDRAARKGERFIIERRGKAVAALVPIEDLEVLEAFEDRMDVEEAERILADPAEKPIPYEQVRQELGLE